MKHRIGHNKLNRKPSHRKALHRNMVTSLFKHERIRTTKAKAAAIRRTAEKMITRAKVDSVHNRRMVGRDIKDQAILAKLFTELGPRFNTRPGGYTRMLKIGQRRGDAAQMVLLELVADELESQKSEAKPKSRRAAKKEEKSPKSAEGKTEEAEKADSAPAPETSPEVETSSAPEAAAQEEPAQADAENADEPDSAEDGASEK